MPVIDGVFHRVIDCVFHRVVDCVVESNLLNDAVYDSMTDAVHER